MTEVMLAVDILLAALLGDPTEAAADVIDKARSGDWKLHVTDQAVFWALRSVRPDDSVDLERFTDLLQYTHILPATNPGDRANWNPDPNEVDNWRRVALGL